MLHVGLTGGIAAGKSTVAAELARLGAEVVDADEVVHALLAPQGSAVAPVVARFGQRFRDTSGGIDRAALAELVFADPAARRDLETILHPQVRDEAARRFGRAAKERRCRIGVFDAALLVETGAYRDYDRLIVVRCPPQVQILRLVRRAGLTEQEARARIAAQAPLADKLVVADYVIDTGGTLQQTIEHTHRVWRLLERDARERG
ncbi:MAG TPA: dephospho-CoA kinase [Candidatus Polarisedimenticolaceae bacterium]|nr:dephospho-CoA kinase [Candidatus Polarisedimenticolaceae bacterium]